jgi:type VI secretion system protein ImpM
VIGVGLFGKIPANGDFVSMGMGSTTGRSFDRWSQMANDMVAQEGRELPRGPIGFCFRDETGSSLLIGVMIASRDKVGRKFPLSLFCEVGELGRELRSGASGRTDGQLPVAGFPGVFAPAIARMCELAISAESMSFADLRAGIAQLPVPEPASLAAQLRAEVGRLAEAPLHRVLRRIYGKDGCRAHGTEILIRACEQAVREGPRRPITIDVKATSDVELLFWIACVESRLQGALGPLSAFWDVPAQRALLAPGIPDSNTLNFLCSRTVHSARLWGTVTATEDAELRARDRLDPELVELLLGPETVTASELVSALAPSA